MVTEEQEEIPEPSSSKDVYHDDYNDEEEEGQDVPIVKKTTPRDDEEDTTMYKQYKQNNISPGIRDELYSLDSKSFAESQHSADGNNNGGRGGVEKAPPTPTKKSIDHDETRMVNRSKLVVYLVILLSAALAGTVTFLFVKDEEKRWYEDEFQDLSTDIFDYTNVNLNKLHESTHAVAESWTSFGTYENNNNNNNKNNGDQDYNNHIVEIEEEEDPTTNTTNTTTTTTTMNTTTTNISEDNNNDETDDYYNYSYDLNTTLSSNVTYPHFGLTVGNLASLSNAEILFVAPMIAKEDRVAWEDYATKHQGWIKEDLTIAKFTMEESSDDDGDEDGDEGGSGSSEDGDGDGKDGDGETNNDDDGEDGDGESISDDKEDMFLFNDPGQIRTSIYSNTKRDESSSSQAAGFYLPIWQTFPTPQDAYNSPVMFDLLSYDFFENLVFGEGGIVETKSLTLSPVLDLINFLMAYQESDSLDDPKWLEPKSLMVQPIFDNLNPSIANVAGVVVAIIEWTDYLDEDIGEGAATGMIIDLEYDCPGIPNKVFSFTKEGTANEYLGENYVHDSKYDYIIQRQRLMGDGGEGSSDSEDGDESGSGSESGSEDGDGSEEESEEEDRRFLDESGDGSEDGDAESSDESDSDDVESNTCSYYISVHMTDAFVEEYEESSDAVLYTAIVCSIFILTGLVFLVYDCLVQNRNRKVVNTAERSNAIVTSLFPKNVAERMMEEPTTHSTTPKKKSFSAAHALQALGAPDGSSSSDVGGVSTEQMSMSKKPIADLFSETTIMFADIAGFTAWSSSREPTQVFHLLETIFNAFDVIADRRKIFKVETVGDCYVAVCGLPTPNRDHAVAMARFAWEALLEMNNLMSRLEVELGPDTNTLNMRFGIHSGPVTAGVLRGQKARFQLFGDSMNKASRIETSGKAGRVHLSKETADLLIARGKAHWLTKREDMVHLKGLGQLSTYWLEIKSEGSVRTDSSTPSSDRTASRKKQFFAEHTWHTKVLSMHLQKIVAYRNQQSDGTEANDEESLKEAESQAVFGKGVPNARLSFPIIEDEVDGTSVELDSEVLVQLGQFVEEIAQACNPNPFHNFEHSRRMVMAVTKLLSVMESSDLITLDDPMTQFAIVLSALIHDVDHPGISNYQLAAGGHPLVTMYQSGTVERNSLDVAWKLLNQDCYLALRRTIYRTPAEFEWFRELVVHTLLVSDIMDKDLRTERQERWSKTFNNETSTEGLIGKDLIDMQKTELLEKVMQSSDVFYPMQHWNVYRQWNQCLYNEMSKAHQEGRIDQDPSLSWYEGELMYFDSCIIPLVHRLKRCPVLKAAGEELLQYALSNRKEWEETGKSLLENF